MKEDIGGQEAEVWWGVGCGGGVWWGGGHHR